MIQWSLQASFPSIADFPQCCVFLAISSYSALLVLEQKASTHHKIACLLSWVSNRESSISKSRSVPSNVSTAFLMYLLSKKSFGKWELLSVWRKTTLIKTLFWHLEEVVLNASLSALCNVCVICRDIRESHLYQDSSVNNKKLLYSWSTWPGFSVQMTSYEQLCCSVRNIIRLSGEDGWGAVICRK